jgi:ABC-2 type transport system ATP-binding protein
MQQQIQVNNLTKKFNNFTAVNNLSFNVSQGEVLGFLGPNGAGKTTSMRMITGYMQPTAGSISVYGHDIVKDTIAAQNIIGYVPEGAPLYPDMTPKMFLTFVGKVRGLSSAKLNERLDYVANKLHLHSMWEQTIDTLSKGFKRRVALAQALLHDPKILILDEPTDGLDPLQKKEIRSLIKELAHNKTIIISTHILEEVQAVCTRAMIIANGVILVDDIPANLLARDKYHQSVLITLDTTQNIQTQVHALEQLEYVASVEYTPDDSRMLILPKTKDSILQPVTTFCQAHNVPVKSVSEHTGQLDRVFCQIIESHNQI